MSELGKIWCFSKNPPEICCWKSKLILKLHARGANNFSTLKKCRNLGWKRLFLVLPSTFSGYFELEIEISGALLLALEPLIVHISLELLQQFADAP